MKNSACASPSGRVKARGILFIICFVLSNLVWVTWLLCLGVMRGGVVTDRASADR